MATLDSLYDCSESWSLGSGANGSVYTAVQLATGTTVALKLMPADDGLAPDELDGWVDYMLDLVSLQAGLDHPNIAPILDIFTDRSTGAVLTAMPLYSGGSAAHFLQRHEHLGERHIARIVRSVCLAVHYCHINGVVHRDIKLENVLFESEAADAEPKLIDFGMALRAPMDPEQDNIEGGMSTLVCMAPEMFWAWHFKQAKLTRSRPDVRYGNRIDVWAVGVLAFQLLAGCLPFGMGDPSEDEEIVGDRVVFEPLAFPPTCSASDDAQHFAAALLVRQPRDQPPRPAGVSHPALHTGPSHPAFHTRRFTPVPSHSTSVSHPACHT